MENIEKHRNENGHFHFVYKLINIETGKYYIGGHSTPDLDDGYLGSGAEIRKIVKEIGKTRARLLFKREIIKFCKDNDALKNAERKYIAASLNDEMCYNKNKGGACQGKKTEEQKQKIALAASQNRLSEESRKKVSESMKLHRKLNPQHTDKVREGLKKWREANPERKNTPEWKDRMEKLRAGLNRARENKRIRNSLERWRKALDTHRAENPV